MDVYVKKLGNGLHNFLRNHCYVEKLCSQPDYVKKISLTT